MQIGPYAIVAELARGGMGAVYRARDPAGNPVALKLLLGHRNRSERGLRRFAIELETHARLRHPHVVGVRGSGVHEGVPYVVLDYVEGETLQARLDRQGPLPAAEVLRIGRALASALCHAHDHGVVHRDVKPENVLMDRRGQVRLSDFGLALDLESSNERLTLTGHFLGTPGYWAPEQALGRKHALGPPTDVYGLGATLYGLASGRPPLTGSAMAQLDAFDAVPPLVTLQPRAPAGLCALIHGCLRREPQARPRATEVLAELDRLQLETPAARSARLTRSRLIAALVVLTVICGALVCALAWRVHSRALHEAAAPVDAREGSSPPV
ncbi:MAG: serine/threonine protein kinase, partial [Planctomycetes bacterium]|nr:serine/threonine protein kinase [Planctomycetota bacterium]